MTTYRMIHGTDVAVDGMLDVTNPETVSIQRSSTGRIIWVNIDGVCRLRIHNPGHFLFEDLSGKLEMARVDE